MVRDGYFYGAAFWLAAVLLVYFTGAWWWAILPVLLAGLFPWLFRDPRRQTPLRRV
jgi:hypothetical protein